MSGSETAAAAVVTTTEQFSIGVHQKSPAPVVHPPPPVVQNMHLSYNSSDGTPLYKPIPSSGDGDGDGDAAAAAPFLPQQQQQLSMMMMMNAAGESKKKRGRPRKYGPDGSMALALTPSPLSAHTSNIAFSLPNQSQSQSQQQPDNSPVGGSGSLMKKARGRPPGSSNKKHQTEALGSAGIGFTPHVISVKAGEDVSSKIMSFSQNGPRAVCILSASGAISNVTLRQAATSGGTATYEGHFDILSLSGSFLLSEVGGQRSRTGGLSVSLVGPDGRVLGGCVAGLLTAASPVQVIVGSFIADGRKEPRVVNHLEPLSSLPHSTPGSLAAGPGSPQSRGTLSESSGGPASPLTQSTGAFHNSHPQGMSSMPWK